MKEVWLNIKNYPNYEISSLGRVKSLNYKNTKVEKLIKPIKLKNGYLQVNLYANNKMHHKYVHRLVAEAFLDNPNNLPQINHKDENTQNNIVDNLEYCDAKYNNNYGTHNKRVSASQQNNPKKSKPILQYNKQGNLITEYPSIIEIQRQLGFAAGNISRCCRGEFKQAYGFIWRYKNEE